MIDDGRLPTLGRETEPETPAASPSALDIETISFPTALTSEVETVPPELTLWRRLFNWLDTWLSLPETEESA